MKYEMKLQAVYFNKIKSGEKIYEIRLNDEKRQKINVGDVITFFREPELNEKIDTIVEELIYFNSFKSMLNDIPLSKIGFEDMDKKSIENIYHSFYSTENEKKFGVLAIKIKLI